MSFGRIAKWFGFSSETMTSGNRFHCEDVAGWDRFKLICKPEQSAKTFLMINEIISEFENDQQNRDVINFIFCDNNLLLTKQTTERISSEKRIPVAEDGLNYVEFSSRKSATTSNNIDSVVGKIAFGARNIVCCTNSRRIADINELINRLEKLNMYDFTFKIWLDEADKFTKAISEIFRPLADKFQNVFVNCITATPGRLFSKFKNMKVLPIEKTTSPQYHGWNDNNIKIMENNTETTEGFVNEVIETLKKNGNKPSPGTKWFVPAESKKMNHNKIKDILVKHGFAVFVVNSNGLSLTIPGNDCEFIEKKSKVLNEQLREMLAKHDCSNFPIAVTGNVCIGRGISIMSPNFMFDHGIMSFCGNESEVSQTAGRLKGNIKSWPGYKKPTVYTTKEFNEIATEFEIKSRSLACLAFSKNAEVPSVITNEEFRCLSGKDSKWNVDCTEFNCRKEANEFLKKNGFRRNHKVKKDSEGFLLSPTISKTKKLVYSELKKDMIDWDPLANIVINKKKPLKRYGKMYICYKNPTDITSVMFMVRIVTKNE